MSMCGSLLKYFSFTQVSLVFFVIVHSLVNAQDEYMVKVSAEGKLGENAVISCHVSPETNNITWLFNDQQINISERLKKIDQNLTRPEKDNDGNVKIDLMSNITITNVTLNDVGQYTCLAQWANEIVSNNTKMLDLRFEGRLVSKNSGPIKIKASKDGSFIKLWCVFEVYNVTEMKWWKRNSNDFEPVLIEANIVNLKQINGSYSLNISQPTENGTYVCEVYDRVKMQSMFGDTDIIVYDKPRVIIDQVVAVSTTELFINWTVFAYNSKIISYELWYRNAMEPKSNFMMSNKKVDVNSSSHILSGLNPSTNYSVKLVVRTEYNISQPDVYRNIVVTLDKEPVFVPNISIKGFSATSVTIGWEKPPEDIAHLIHYYLLEARKKDQEDEKKQPYKAYHSSDSRNLPYMFEHLEPYSTYIFRVRACSDYTKRCGNWSENQEAVTLDGIPSKPGNVSAYCDRHMMNVSWSPPLKPNAEIKGYQVELRGNAKYRDSNGVMQLANWGPTSKFMTNDSRNAKFDDLKPNTSYVVKVSAMTRIRRRGEEAVASCVTRPAPPPLPPQPPFWSKIYESGKYVFKTHLQRVSERNGPICCYRVYMVRLLPDSDRLSLPESPKVLPVITYKDAHASEPVFGAYATDVFTNDEFPVELVMGDGTTFVAKTFLPQCVFRCLHKPVSLPSAPPVIPPTTTSAEVEEIDVTTVEVPILEQKTRRDADLQPMDDDDLIADEAAKYVDIPDTGYLNVNDGPLNSTANYTMFVELIPGTDDESLYSDFLTVLTPAPIPVPAAPNAAIEIALQVTCAIAAAVLLGMIIFCIMQTRRSRKLPHAALEMGPIPNILRYFWPTIRRQQLVSQTPPDLPPIAKEDLPAAYAERQADSDYGFQKEFELLQMLPECFSDRTTYASEARENQPKNRYPDIKAYDQTRVKLSQIDGITGSDYINANFVMGYQERKQFICAQGPTDTTVNDFWRMIWEHGLELIVMLTNLEEYSKIKCSKYWPDEIRGSRNFGSVTVSHVGEKRYSDYIVRELKITKQPTTVDGQPIIENNGVAKRNGECKDGEASATTSPRENKPLESRIVKQYHFLMWKDFAAPDHSYSILKFIKRVNEAWSSLMGRPIVVHCSAGVGRTGTLVALDCLLEQLRATGQVAVFNTVAELRRQRNFLVQSLKQYVFVYRALVEYAHYGDTEITASRLKSSVDRLRNTPEGADKCLMEHEFEQMVKKPVPETSKSCAAGAAEEVRPKNRSQECLPYDRNRVILTPIPGRDFSTYINASFIEAYDNSEGFIITQDPLPSTIADFWRMVSEHNVATVVMLSEIGEGKCPRYWDDNTATYEHISVQYEESESCPYYTRRQFRVTNNKSGDVSCVRQLQYQGWPTASGAVPEVTRGLAELADAAAPHAAPLSAPMLVHCQLGTERSSLFVALCILICQLRTERLVDVNCVARKIRDQRAKTIDTFVHYEFLHRAILNYAELHNLLEDS